VPDEISFSDLIASSIHDMKNSLNVQVSALETIAVQCRDRGDTSMYEELGRVIYQTNRMSLNLVELLSLYKLGKAIYPVDMDEYAVADVMHEAVLQSRFMMEFKGISVTTDCAPDCYWYMDRDLVKGVLVNALNNAYHYTTNAIHLSARIHNKWLELRVEDNGPGYPDHMLESGKLDSERAVNFATGSTGLGFYFSAQVAQLHKNGKKQGTLSIENGGTLGGGCFLLRLP
jgi:K+-sensing histidine kinase KdpD